MIAVRTTQETRRVIVRNLEISHQLADALYDEASQDASRKDAADTAYQWRASIERALGEIRDDEWVDDDDEEDDGD